MRKILLLLLRYIPIMQMVGMLFNNTIYYFRISTKLAYYIDFTLGNSLITTILLFICSYVFKYCNWYRLIIAANFINICIANYDAVFRIPINNAHLLMSYWIVATIFVIIAIYSKFNCNESKSNKTSSKAS